MRKTLPALKKMVGSGDTLFRTMSINPIKAVGGDAVKFTASVKIQGQGDFLIADDNGRTKYFNNIDDLFKSMSAFGLVGTSEDQDAVNGGLVRIDGVTLTTPEYFEPKPFTGDPLKKAAVDKVKAQNKVTGLTEKLTYITAQIAAMPNVTSAEQALVAERTAQKVAMDESKQYWQAEVTRLSAIIASAGD